MVPPTVVEPVEANAPERNRATCTVWMLFAKTPIRCMSAKPSAETMYNGCLPNSSLKLPVTRGVTAKPNVYMDSPTVASNCEQLRSGTMPSKSMLYVAAFAAERAVKSIAHKVIVHFRCDVKSLGSRGSFFSNWIYSGVGTVRGDAN